MPGSRCPVRDDERTAARLPQMCLGPVVERIGQWLLCQGGPAIVQASTGGSAAGAGDQGSPQADETDLWPGTVTARPGGAWRSGGHLSHQAYPKEAWHTLLADTGASSPSSPRKARSKSPSDRPCRYSSGINSATFLVLLTNSGSSRLSNCSSVSRTRGRLSCIVPELSVSPNPPMRSGLGVGTRGEGRGTRRSALDSDKWGRWRPLVGVGGADGGPGQRRWGGVGGTACKGRQSRTGPVRLCGVVE